MSETVKQKILDRVEDLVSSFLYYDRKEDEDLVLGEIDKAIEIGEITLDEIVARFKGCLIVGLKD